MIEVLYEDIPIRLDKVHHFAIRARIRPFFVVNNGEEWKAILLLLSFALETKEGKQRNYYRVASQNYNISRGNLI